MILKTVEKNLNLGGGSDRNIVGGCNLRRVVWERLAEVIFESRHKELSGSREF